MSLDSEQLKPLIDPDGLGAVLIEDFIDEDLLFETHLELFSQSQIPWRSNHKTYQNKAGRMITENYDVFSARLNEGDQSILEKVPNLLSVSRRVADFVRSLDQIFPSLVDWQPDEMSIHKYHVPDEVGLSPHRDHTCFKRIIAITSLFGVANITIGDVAFDRVAQGDLMLLRAPGLIDSDKDTRPLHSVASIETTTRVSLTLRDNDDPSSLPERYVYDNWNPPVELQDSDQPER